jgi:multiple sugar transport system ATP-binding protein
MKIQLEDLTKSFPGRGRNSSRVTAVKDFNFEIPDGELIGLLGPSGCGKSTTLNMICGLEKPTSGKIFFGDKDVTALPPEKRGVGMVFQNYALYPHLTVRQNIIFPLQNLKGKDKISRAEMEKRAMDVAALVQIQELMERKPGELSGGQQQRVAIARALVKLPHVLLLDEPLSNLDARLRLQTREEIRKIQRTTKITTVFVTHDQEEAMSISDRIVVMKAGVVQQTGKPQEVYDDPVNLFVAKFLGTPPINVFQGKIKNGKVCIGDAAVLDAPGQKDRDVFVGIRPEGFLLKEDGPLICQLGGVEVMGRDISIVSNHEASLNPNIRSIISAETKVDTSSEIVRFAVKPSKLFVFDGSSEERIRI